MRRKKIWVVTLMAFMVLALPALAQKGKKPKKGQIPVTATFQDDPSHNIWSDGAPYDRDAFIGAAKGNFHLGIVGKGKRPADRWLNLDFSECATQEQCTPPPGFDPSGSSEGKGAVNLHTFGIDLREIAQGDSSPIELSVTMDLIEDGIWTVFFRGTNTDCDGGLASVTRIDDVTWEIKADYDDLACLGQSEGGSALIPKGLYHMPFLITVVCKDFTQCDAP